MMTGLPVLARLALAWRPLYGATVLLALLGAFVLPTQLDSMVAPFLTTPLRLARGGSVAVLVVYLIWLLANLGLRLWRWRQRRRSLPRRGTLLALNLPRPIQVSNTTAPGGHVEAVAGSDPMRALIVALSGGELAGQVALELWSGVDGRVQWAVWVEDVGPLPDTVQRLLLGALPGADLRPLDDPLQQTST
jgi:hypothetical protein